MKGLVNERLPRLLSIKRKVDNGEQLSDWNITYLEQSIIEARRIEILLERNPEYRELMTRLLHLYWEITDRALENERKQSCTGVW